MWPRLGDSRLVSRWIAVTLGASIVAIASGGWLVDWIALAPARVWRGEVWRLVTWPLVELGPKQLVVTCLVIYKFGGELAVRWGDRRLRRFMLELVIAAGVVTCALAALAGAGDLQRAGGWAVTDVLVVAWARQFPLADVAFYGIVTLRGQQLVTITLGVTLLYALYAGPVVMAPELVACGAAVLYPKGWLQR